MLKKIWNHVKKIRSNHSSLLNYFIHDRRDLSPAYVASCENFFRELKNLKLARLTAANVQEAKAPSSKRQASSATKKTQLNSTRNYTE